MVVAVFFWKKISVHTDFRQHRAGALFTHIVLVAPSNVFT